VTTQTVHQPADLATIPAVVPNQIGGEDIVAADGRTFVKLDPATGRPVCAVARSTAADVQAAVELARRAHAGTFCGV
jgi:acyl-CoA reductase-like NAD-dependent aldehyde dehydrogenase